MGCDIHLYSEVRRNGKWQLDLGPGYTCPSCNGTGEITYGEGARAEYRGQKGRCCNCWGKGRFSVWRNRSYNTFAVLADVRNSGGITPIADPRGLPVDTDPAGREHLSDEHTQSWLTLAEIDAYFAKTHPALLFGGYIRVEHLREFLEKPGYPQHGYCGGVGGGDVRILTTSQALDAVHVGTVRTADYVYVAWSEALKDVVCPDFFVYLDSLRPLAESEDIRLVFDFDS